MGSALRYDDIRSGEQESVALLLPTIDNLGFVRSAGIIKKRATSPKDRAAGGRRWRNLLCASINMP